MKPICYSIWHVEVNLKGILKAQQKMQIHQQCPAMLNYLLEHGNPFHCCVSVFFSRTSVRKIYFRHTYIEFIYSLFIFAVGLIRITYAVLCCVRAKYPLLCIECLFKCVGRLCFSQMESVHLCVVPVMHGNVLLQYTKIGTTRS